MINMQFRLGRYLKVGQKIKTENGWRKIKEINESGVTVKEGFILYGSTVFGWKAS